MNHEQATESVDPGAVAQPIALGTTTALAFSVIRQHPGFNVRGESELSGIEELAEHIALHGVLQNLNVAPIPLPKKGKGAKTILYGVAAGRRRFAALSLLVEAGRLADDTPIPVKIVPADQAMTVSLAENLYRLSMDAVEQYRAFQKLVDEGRSIEQIATDFLCTEHVVRRRLQLANVHPTILDAHRAGDASLDQLMAYASSDDQEAQLRVYEGGRWLSPNEIRKRLHGEEVDGATHPLAMFVGAEAFEAAGGVIRRDLFSAPDHPGFWSPADLLDVLVKDRLAEKMEKIRKEGWAWVDCYPRIERLSRYEFPEAPKIVLLTPEQEAARAPLVERVEAVAAAIDAAYERLDAEDDEPEVGPISDARKELLALFEERRGLVKQIETIDAKGKRKIAADAKPFAGAFVGITEQGRAVTVRGLLRREDSRTLAVKRREQERGAVADGAPSQEHAAEAAPNAAGQDALPPYPKVVWMDLMKARTAALQAEVAVDLKVALALLAANMATTLVDEQDFARWPMEVRAQSQMNLSQGSEPYQGEARMRERHTEWCAELEAIHESGDSLLQGLLRWPVERVQALLAFCAAATIVEVNDMGKCGTQGRELARAVKLDMHDWWQPSEAFFGQLRKSTSLAVVDRFAPSQGKAMVKNKKDAIAQAACRLAASNRWLPPIFEGADAGQPSASDEPQPAASASDGETPPDNGAAAPEGVADEAEAVDEGEPSA